MSAEHVDQVLDRILGSHVAEHCREHGGDHDEMAEESPPHVASEKAEYALWTRGVAVAWRDLRTFESGADLFFVNSPRRPDG